MRINVKYWLVSFACFNSYICLEFARFFCRGKVKAVVSSIGKIKSLYNRTFRCIWNTVKPKQLKYKKKTIEIQQKQPENYRVSQKSKTGSFANSQLFMTINSINVAYAFEMESLFTNRTLTLILQHSIEKSKLNFSRNSIVFLLCVVCFAREINAHRIVLLFDLKTGQESEEEGRKIKTVW